MMLLDGLVSFGALKIADNDMEGNVVFQIETFKKTHVHKTSPLITCTVPRQHNISLSAIQTLISHRNGSSIHSRCEYFISTTESILCLTHLYTVRQEQRVLTKA